MATIVEQDKSNLKAKKFLVWLFVISSFMLFAALTSGFIVYTAGNVERGIKIMLPKAFMYSTAVIVLSSITMHMAYLSAKRLQFGKQQAYLLFTILLGIVFFVFQFSSWKYLTAQGYTLSIRMLRSRFYTFLPGHIYCTFSRASSCS